MAPKIKAIGVRAKVGKRAKVVKLLKKKVKVPVTRKDWYDVKAASVFPKNNTTCLRRHIKCRLNIVGQESVD